LRLDNLYSSLAKPNCTVLRENLTTYTEHGVISADKKTGAQTERKFDVIIFGTGFNVAQYLEHEKIFGLGGSELQSKWKEHPEALYGVATNQFPNMFMCFGPNSATVWSSQQDIWEQQARFNAKFVREIVKNQKRGQKLAVHPQRDVERQYNQEVQKGQAGRFVWARPDCVTYYKNDAGWNTFTMPWSWFQFRAMLRKIRWREWETIQKKPA
jgi:cation diffusion facilitator CzcD-associated flavoprotein CzcO